MDRLNNIGELKYTPLFITKNQSENNMTKMKFECDFHTQAELDEMLERHCINQIKECDTIIDKINQLESWDDLDKDELEYAQYRKVFYQAQLNK